jgi:hypothetical protein
VAFLNWRFGLTQTTLWRIDVAPFPGLSNVATPTKAIITIPITLYRDWNGDDAEEGIPRGGVMGGSKGSARPSTSDAGVKLGVPTSSRTSLPARIEIAVPPGREELIFIHTSHPRSDPQDPRERQCSTGGDVHDGSSRSFGYLPWRCYWPLTNSS